MGCPKSSVMNCFDCLWCTSSALYFCCSELSLYKSNYEKGDVLNKQVERALINFFYQCITIFFRANSIVLKHPLYSKGFSSLKRLLFNPLQTEKGKLWSRHKPLLYPYSSNFHFSVKKRYVFPCLAFTSTSKRACSWNVALLSFPLTPFSHWQQKLCVWKMLP